MTRWVFVTGGVLSGLGKGLITASAAKLLQARGLSVVPVKCDGYLNVDPGTMNPHEHGEVFVLDAGAEVDMDFGHYERFLNVAGEADWNLTNGKIFNTVIEQERDGDYLGETVQMVPHVTDEIKGRLRTIADEEAADVIIVEVGGTVGDMENMMYLEAIRQLRNEAEHTALLHATLVPYLDTTGEQKTKPTQHSVKELQRAGLQPDVLIGRSGTKLADAVKEKIALFCDVEKTAVISDPDIDNIYELPLILQDEGLGAQLAHQLAVAADGTGMDEWQRLVDRMNDPSHTVRIALAGKYTDMDDSYVSIEEALKHAGAHLDVGVDIALVETTEIEDGAVTVDDALDGFDGVVISPGFGPRGTAGKLQVARYCREHDVPALGICYGMQMMLIEYARHVCGLDGAHTTEVDAETAHPVVDILPAQADVDAKGGTMRLGASPAELQAGSQVRELYGKQRVSERHRHRYEVNPDYHGVLQDTGLVLSGTSEDGKLVEYMELPDHPFYVGTQAHPEFTSRLEAPNPLYRGFLDAVLDA